MRVFIYEYICGGGLAGRPLPESLAREGWAMLASLVEDFAQVERCEVLTTLDERLAGRPLAAHHIERLGPDDERDAIERLAARSDWTLLIAPESGRALYSRTCSVEDAGCRLLGSSRFAVAVAGDKLGCSRRLQEAGVPAVVGRVVRVGEAAADLGPIPWPAVLKPRDGAGSQDTFFAQDAATLARLMRELATNCGRREHEFVLEPFIVGRPASVTLLVGPHVTIPLLAGEQLLSSDGRFQYLGGRMPLEPALAARAVALATRAVAAIPGLRGLVGVDLVLGPDVVIEINPRPTTSYAGLRRLAIDNLAHVWLQLARGREPEQVRWRPGSVCFQADGTLA